uniref:Uncharacterized protein n=1 Tax=Oryza rufipogon TaxID=4529 RepID=A0A0E0PQ53_ORYRU
MDNLRKSDGLMSHGCEFSVSLAICWDCLNELPFVRFLLKDRIGGQPTTGGIAPLHQIKALLRKDSSANVKGFNTQKLYHK